MSEVREKIDIEKKKLKNMTWKERFEYIWEYYKFHIGIIVFLIIVFASLLNHFVINPPKHIYMDLSLYGWYIEETDKIKLSEDLSTKLVSNPEKEEVFIQSFVYSGSDSSMNMMVAQKFIAILSSKGLDAIIAEEKQFNDLAGQGVCADLSEFLPESTYNTLTDKIIESRIIKYDKDVIIEEGELTPYGISLDGNKYLAQFGIETKGKILFIAANTTKKDIVLEALSYILEY